MKKTAPHPDPEIAAFEAALLRSVDQMQTGQVSRTTAVALTPAAQARSRLGLSQSAFARLIGVSTRTLQDWEQGRRQPSGAARTLLRIAVESPDAVRRVLLTA